MILKWIFDRGVALMGNTGTGSCFAEKGIELQAEMLAAQFFYKFS